MFTSFSKFSQTLKCASTDLPHGKDRARHGEWGLRYKPFLRGVFLENDKMYDSLQKGANLSASPLKH